MSLPRRKAKATATAAWMLGLILGSLAGLPAVVGAQGAQGSAHARLLVPDSAPLIGQPLSLTLVVTHPPGSLLLPVDIPTRWGELEIESQSPPQLAVDSDSARRSQQIIRARAWATGSLSIEPMTVTLAGPDGATSRLQSQPARLEIRGSLPAGEDLPRDIRGQIELPRPARWPVWLLALSLSAALALFAGRRLGARLARQRRTEPGAVDYGPAARLALRVLEALDAEALLERGDTVPHYDRASDALRAYLEAVFGLPALDRSSQELIEALEALGVTTALRGRLAGLLAEADLVKFARHRPAVERSASYTDRLREAIERVERERRGLRALAALRRGSTGEGAAS